MASEFTVECNRLLRSLGCQFSGDTPGRSIEEWAHRSDPRGESPRLEALGRVLRSAGYRFAYSPAADRAFTHVWRLLCADRDRLVAVQLATGAMRVFAELAAMPIGEAEELALTFLEEIEKRYDPNRQCVEGPSGATDVDCGTQRSAKPVQGTTNDQIRSVFVSYSHQDAPIVSPIVGLMRVVGAEAFRDADSIEPGQVWREVIITAIEHATHVIVFWSQHSATSPAVRAEWVQGINLRKIIVPVLLDSTPLDPALAIYQWLDLRSISVAAVLQSDQAGPHRERLLKELAADSVAEAVTRLLRYLFGGA